MPTIRDVAAHAKVSVTTVSHVINGTRFVDPQTQERVRAAIETLNYRPNSVARSLRRRSTHTIGLLVPDIANPFFGDIARTIEDAGFAEGYNVILCNSDRSDIKESVYVDVLLSKQIDGLILISSGSRPDPLQSIIDAKVPVVVADRELSDLPVDQVLVDNQQGGYLVGQYLASLGHRRVGCIAGPHNLRLSMERITGFRRALNEVGLSLPDEALVYGDFHYSGGEAGMLELLQRDLNLTAVFAANDSMAVGAINVLHRANLRIPRDVSVIGFDNTTQSKAMSPGLTTIAQPITELGRASVSLLLERIKQPDQPLSRLLLPTTLIERESCSSPPAYAVERPPMKKTGVLHSQLSQIIASLGHTDLLVISDAGLPVPPGVLCIDLAVSPGLPPFLDVVRAVAGDVEAEKLIVAAELLSRDEVIPAELQVCFPNAHMESVPHEQFKALTAKARAVVRTGEYTPYANVIIQSGVTF